MIVALNFEKHVLVITDFDVKPRMAMASTQTIHFLGFNSKLFVNQTLDVTMQILDMNLKIYLN